MTVDLRASAIAAVVLDIEGTTTPIAFVYDVLFPFARRTVRRFLAERWESTSVDAAVEELRAEWARDLDSGQSPPPWSDAEHDRVASLAAYVEWLMDHDRKSTGLKLLQGLVWERGYQDGTLTSDVFPDVAPALTRWRASEIEVAIYSSGSVLAQRLLFGHTPEGDLTPLVSGFFDTAVGPKTSPESYRRIARSLGRSPNSLLFVSDVARELEAASGADWHAVLCRRPGNAPQPGWTGEIVEDFADLILR